MSAAARFGVRIIGTGSAVPSRVLTNHDLEKMVDTSDEWIVQRTGIRERRIVNPQTEGTYTLCVEALSKALATAGLEGADLDVVIVASVTSEMTCPSTACRVAHAVKAAPAGAFDIVAACCGFVYGLNVADALLKTGLYRTIAVIGCDTMSTVLDYGERTVSILFGDGAGAAILRRDDDPSVGCLYQTLQADGTMWESLYMPRRCQDVPAHDRDNPIKLGCLRMNGREIYRFAVGKFREVIKDALSATGLEVDQISEFICHQSNLRIIEAAKERLGLPDDRVFVNIDRYGNTSAGSIGLCLDELWRAGRIRKDSHVLFVAFGGGLTWSVSLWKM